MSSSPPRFMVVVLAGAVFALGLGVSAARPARQSGTVTISMLAIFTAQPGFDVLIPDATHDDDAVVSIEHYYTALFDLWFDNPAHAEVKIRILENMVRGALGQPSSTESIGYGPTLTVTMLSDGSLEPLDVLRIAGNRANQATFNVREHQFQDVEADPAWREAQHASLNLCETCQACELKTACGGGYLPSRWSQARRYDNPTVYCQDIKGIFRHIKDRVAPTLYAAPPQA